MSPSNYRDLVVWQRSRALTTDLYRLTRRFPREELFGLSAQLRSAALSIPSNIAESQGRGSRREVIRFLIIARGSALEVETQLLIAADLEFLDREQALDLLERAAEIGRMLNGLINYQRRH